MSMDDFDQLLAQQRSASSDGPSLAEGKSAQTSTASAPITKLRSLFSCSVQYFDPLVELKRNFGAAAIRAYEAEEKSSSGGGAAASRAAPIKSAALNPNMRLRGVLVQPKPEWPPINQTFTGMSMQDTLVEGKGRTCNWIHSRCVTHET